MVSIFLSYARDDLAKAERIARALEKAGHTIWWDRQLHAGERFSAEIDKALKGADVVVVLWSRASVQSAWVHDEAAAGRDSSRLVPVLIEPVIPPLGFRQYQAVDLSSQSSHRNRRALAQLVEAIGSKPSAENRQQEPDPTTSPSRRWWPAAATIAAIAAIAAITGYLLLRPGHSSPTIVVTSDRSGDVQASRDFAHQVAADLARFRAADLSSVVVREGPGSSDYRAEMNLERTGAKSSASISLSIAQRPGLTWAKTIEGKADRIVDLRQQAAAVLSAVLRCVLEADSSRTHLRDSDLRLFLDGCTAVSMDFWQGNAADLIPTFKQITQSNPDFAPAQAMLALAYGNAFSNVTSSDQASVLVRMRAALARAKSLDPDLEDVIAVDALMHSSDPKQWDHEFPILDRGLAVHPGSGLLLGLRSQMLMSIGRMTEAAVNARQALQQDPLSPQARVNLIDALVYSGHLVQARDELARAEAIWPSATMIDDTRYRLDLRYGDPRNALRLFEARSATGDYSGPGFDQSWEDFLAARIRPTPVNIDAALHSFRERYRRDPADIPGYIQALGTFGRVDEAFAVSRNPATLDSMEASTDTLFRPHMRGLMADPRFIDLAHRLGLLAYWKKSGAWPDFCSDPALPYDCRKEAAKYR